jgi:predicted peroxiredoxin
MPETKQEKMLIIATHGPEDPERATFPFVIANAALVMDVEVSIAWQGVSVILAMKDQANHVFAAGLPPLADLLKSFQEQGGKLLVCTPCLNERKITKDMLIEGSELVAAARVVQASLEADAVLCY